jgi:hypothetical protein
MMYRHPDWSKRRICEFWLYCYDIFCKLFFVDDIKKVFFFSFLLSWSRDYGHPVTTSKMTELNMYKGHLHHLNFSLKRLLWSNHTNVAVCTVVRKVDLSQIRCAMESECSTIPYPVSDFLSFRRILLVFLCH